MTTTTVTSWVKQPGWWGNPDLGYDSWMRMYQVRGSGRKVPVYLFGPPDSLELNFCVSAGHHSDLSYTGCFYPDKLDWQQSMERIDQLSNEGKLIR